MLARNNTFRGAVDVYVTQNESWLTDDDAPLVTSLYKCAEALDIRLTAAVLTQFRLVIGDLHMRKPVAHAEKKQEKDETIDEFDRIANSFGLN